MAIWYLSEVTEISQGCNDSFPETRHGSSTGARMTCDLFNRIAGYEGSCRHETQYFMRFIRNNQQQDYWPHYIKRIDREIVAAMDSGLFYFGIPLGIVLILSVGFLLVLIYQQKTKNRYSEKIKLLQSQYKDISHSFKTNQEELARKKEIAETIPGIVRRLTENLPESAIPPIVVRFAKEFFHASRVGYFVGQEETGDYTLRDGAGFPPNLMGRISLSVEEGILGTAVRKKMVASREDLSPTEASSGESFPEHARMELDFVAPITVNSTTRGVLVLGGCGVDISYERQNVAMLADLFGAALQNAITGKILESSASLDDLTGLSSRRHFTLWFETEIRRARNYLTPLSIFLFDIDHFKKVNDTYGHHAGDLVLRKVAEVARKNTRSSDLVSRYGGEEFTVVMTSANREQALSYANLLREIIAATGTRIPGLDNPLRVTISGGIATFPGDGETTTDLLNAADQALYRAKSEGRNKIFTANPVGLDGSPII
jgi:diguanylate cyclase (GGDEF)-like protein